MAPQEHIPLAASILGAIGTFCWCVQLIPQIIRSYRTKSTEGLPGLTMFFWSVSGVPSGAYTIAQRFNIPLMIQPQCFCFLCGVSWAQCLFYGRKWTAFHAIMALAFLMVVCGALEFAIVYTIRPLGARGVSWPISLVGIIACIMEFCGFFPVPFEIIKRRGRLVGFDFTFLAIDWMGAFFSLMSLAAQLEFDVLFGSLYAASAIIEIAMVASHLVWRYRTRHIRRRAEEHGKIFDDSQEGQEWQSKGIDLEERLCMCIQKRKKCDLEENASNAECNSDHQNDKSSSYELRTSCQSLLFEK